MMLDRNAPVFVAGHNGLAGSAIHRGLVAAGFSNILTKDRQELDLRDHSAVHAFFTETRPQAVYLAAAKVGGIMANWNEPTEFLFHNLEIQTNVMTAALETAVPRLLFLGSSCIYPKTCPQPIKEEYLLTGKLEPTNDAYALAKIAGIVGINSIRRQYGLDWISAMPTNLYGPGDNFSLEKSHVLPAMIRKFDTAVIDGGPVINWGTGTPRREFLHVDDFASACLFLMDNYHDDSHVNVGTGKDCTIRELSETIADVVGYSGEVVWDSSKPDGTPQKLLDVSLLTGLGWEASYSLHNGIEHTYQWFNDNRGHIRL